MVYLRTVTHILVSHMLPQLQLFRTHKKTLLNLLTLKKAGTTTTVTKKKKIHQST